MSENVFNVDLRQLDVVATLGPAIGDVARQLADLGDLDVDREFAEAMWPVLENLVTSAAREGLLEAIAQLIEQGVKLQVNETHDA
jgi:hypothetical protein